MSSLTTISNSLYGCTKLQLLNHIKDIIKDGHIYYDGFRMETITDRRKFSKRI